MVRATRRAAAAEPAVVPTKRSGAKPSRAPDALAAGRSNKRRAVEAPRPVAAVAAPAAKRARLPPPAAAVKQQQKQPQKQPQQQQQRRGRRAAPAPDADANADDEEEQEDVVPRRRRPATASKATPKTPAAAAAAAPPLPRRRGRQQKEEEDDARYDEVAEPEPEQDDYDDEEDEEEDDVAPTGQGRDGGRRANAHHHPRPTPSRRGAVRSEEATNDEDDGGEALARLMAAAAAGGLTATGSPHPDDDETHPASGSPRGAGGGAAGEAAASAALVERAAAAHRAAAAQAAAGAAQQEAAHREIGALLPGDLDEAALRAAWLRAPERQRQQHRALQAARDLGRAWFPRWRLALQRGSSLLLHGLGSKRVLLEAFAAAALTDGAVLVAHGHRPGVCSRLILHQAAACLRGTAAPLGRPGGGGGGGGAAAASASLAAAAAAAAASGAGPVPLAPPAPCMAPNEALSAIIADGRRLYVVLHGVDGPGLRSASEQLWLSRLASAPNVSLAASCDHANAALLWDRRAAARFRWRWHECSTLAPYASEARDVAPALVACFRGAQRRGAAAVLASLTASARDVFRLMAELQLEQEEGGGEEEEGGAGGGAGGSGAPGGGGGGAAAGNAAPVGLTFARLYRLARERFVVSSEHALRSHLAEFRDHEIVRARPAADGGGDVLSLPFEGGEVRAMLAALDAAERDELAAAEAS